jgi:hypothetical protein
MDQGDTLPRVMDDPDRFDRDEFDREDGDHYMSIPVFLILTLVTVGVFNLYWNYRQMQACNSMLGRKEFSFARWILFCLLTFFLYHLYYQYRMGVAIVEIQRMRDEPVFEELPVVSLVAAVLGVGIAADCIHQFEINKLAY